MPVSESVLCLQHGAGLLRSSTAPREPQASPSSTPLELLVRPHMLTALLQRSHALHLSACTVVQTHACPEQGSMLLASRQAAGGAIFCFRRY